MRSRTRQLFFGLACLSVATVAGAAPAVAQPGGTVNTSGYAAACSAESVPKERSEAAHNLFKSGKQDYDDNHLDEAIKAFKWAYEKDCSKHELLIIISRAYELKGDKAEAVRALEIFLQREPTNSDADTYRRRIKQLKDSIVAAPAPTPGPTAAPTSSSGGSPPPPKGEDRGHTPYPWILVGVGGAAVVAGVIVLATTPKLPDGCTAATKTCTRVPNETPLQYTERQEAAGRSQTQPTVGGVIAGVGGAVLIGGLLWHFLEPTGPETSGKPKLRPETAPGYAGLSLGGTF
ncbi:MAG: hypothetical protein JST00_26795 [Deltaproteobacteria bacterium]|nr:hypothetical protein [Deltaproteobacteria bacterium]